MLDLGYVRANLAQVKESLGRRGADVAAMLDEFEVLDEKRRAAITRAEMLNAERNRISAEVAERKQRGEDSSDLTDRIRAMKAMIAISDDSAAEAVLNLRRFAAADSQSARRGCAAGNVGGR